jgi:hypothetical protein
MLVVITGQQHIQAYLALRRERMSLFVLQWDRLEPIWWQRRAEMTQRARADAIGVGRSTEELNEKKSK